ncbi:MAG TPA: CobW family GTP-binding protein [Ramlibacter sp.]|nr:CobW family GTP-binding protein [Ramlibacter sp.]
MLPLHLVTGFLGSGKTTLINRVLREPGFAGSMVVVNEFGEVGLDHLLAGSAQDQVLLLDSGCLCCAASGSLRDTLIDLFSRRAAGSLPPFDRLIVETSGLANPGPIVAGLLGDSALKGRCELAQVLVLVDAVHGGATLERHQEAVRQVAFADRIVLTKAAQAAGQAQAMADRIRQLNPDADFVVMADAAPAAAYFEQAVRRAQPGAAGWVRGPLRSQYGDGGAAHGAAFAAIGSQVFQLPGAVPWPAYAHWCDQLRRRFGARLLRCKGLLALGDEGRAHVVQGVQGFFAPPQPYGGPPAKGFIVCIAEGVPREDLAAAFELLQPTTTGTLT